jgi:hypothetical protein
MAAKCSGSTLKALSRRHGFWSCFKQLALLALEVMLSRQKR